MQFDLRKFIATGRQPYHAEFQCDLSAHDYAGARIPQPVTVVFEAETDGDEVLQQSWFSMRRSAG